MGRLSTHVLDTAHGRPADGVAIDLYFLGGQSRQHLARYVTNADGRTDAPILDSEDMVAGVFELVFHIGDYFAAQGVPLPETRFLDSVPIRFGIDDPAANYHVPLLVSPYGYSSYRGS
jgi:5-hydroxyisourate hydrolase